MIEITAKQLYDIYLMLPPALPKGIFVDNSKRAFNINGQWVEFEPVSELKQTSKFFEGDIIFWKPTTDLIIKA